ncbi:MAG TPA: 50S ribosomal protein L6 [Candidatus Dormibacteraeota bacterium]
MSRIGRLPITVPSGVDVSLTGSHLAVSGARGTLERSLPSQMRINVAGGVITVERPSDTTLHRSLHGLTRTLVYNMVEGVSRGFTRNLELVGVGFRATKQGSDLVLTLGYSHPIRYTPPDGVTIEVPAPTQIVISGADKEAVGQVAAKIRSFRKPEPYKGKGILYKGEQIRRKAGKSGKAGKGR